MTEPTGSRPAELQPPSRPPHERLPADLSDPRVQAWFEEHQAGLRRDASGQRILYSSLAIGFVVGLAAHVAGYLLRSTAPTEPLGLLADLLYALGFALWTGVVVVVFVQLLPEAKRRQINRALEAYEATRLDKARERDHGDRTAR